MTNSLYSNLVLFRTSTEHIGQIDVNNLVYLEGKVKEYSVAN